MERFRTLVELATSTNMLDGTEATADDDPGVFYKWSSAQGDWIDVASGTTVTAALADKADITYVDSEVAGTLDYADQQMVFAFLFADPVVPG